MYHDSKGDKTNMKHVWLTLQRGVERGGCVPLKKEQSRPRDFL